MGIRKETNCSNNELRRMMILLNVNNTVEMSALRMAYYGQMKLHHSDKGGSESKAKELTRAYRILKECLEEGISLPDPLNFEEESSSKRYERSGCCPAYQSQQCPRNRFTNENEEFQEFSRRRGKKGNNKGSNNFSNAGFDNSNYGHEFGDSSSYSFRKETRGGNRFRGFNEERSKRWEDPFGNKSEEPVRKDISKMCFANFYKYDNEDLSDYKDPYEKSRSQEERCRTIRGGLILLKDFSSASSVSEYAEFEFTRDFDEIEFYTNPIFESALNKLQNTEESLMAFTEKMETFVNLEWAMSREFNNSSKYCGIQLVKAGDDESIYMFSMPSKYADDIELFTAGIHVDVRSSVDENICAAAIVDTVQNSIITLFILQSQRFHAILAQGTLVNLSVNASTFVFRSMLRAIKSIRTQNLTSMIFPTLEFKENQNTQSQSTLNDLDFFDGDGFNEYQKTAVHSIVKNHHRPYPFLLFGPPGTGKTVTLIEAIRQLTLQSKNNRILVCTPSRMAADNFAESLIDKKFIDLKYVFRMHSLSTAATGRNRKLDQISYLPKEGRGRFYGIPDRLNLQLFRVIICTLTTSSYLVSAGGFRGYFTHIIIDEAGQATETETWIPLGGLFDPKTTSFVLAGDPRQLGPVVNINFLKSHGYSLSMLKRLIYSEPYINSDDRSLVVLKQTYRSHFRILRPCSYLFYDNMLVANEGDDMLYKLCEWEGLPTKGFPIVFQSSAGSEEECHLNKSCSNEREANLVVQYVEKLLSTNSIKPSDIGIISPYKNQVNKLRTLLATKQALTIDSVEGFQGSEREIIIISTVRTRKIGFLSCDLRLNTSISRAKSLLIVIGDENLLRSHPSWQKFIYYCNYHGGYRENVDLFPGDIVPCS